MIEEVYEMIEEKKGDEPYLNSTVTYESELKQLITQIVFLREKILKDA